MKAFLFIKKKYSAESIASKIVKWVNNKKKVLKILFYHIKVLMCAEKSDVFFAFSVFNFALSNNTLRKAVVILAEYKLFANSIF